MSNKENNIIKESNIKTKLPTGEMKNLSSSFSFSSSELKESYNIFFWSKTLNLSFSLFFFIYCFLN